MDPTTALQAIREAFNQGWSADAEEHFWALDDWLTGGGFLPNPWADVNDQH